jgi:acyl-coenzyme A synthetase/AMP-(fatty) acid ligase
MTLIQDKPVPLLSRAPGAVLFRAPGLAVTAAGFLADAQALAASLPEGGAVANLCESRYAFAVAFAAAVIRGQVSLLSADRSAERLADLGRRFPGLYALIDAPADLPVPSRLVRPAGAARAAGPVPAIPATQPAALVFTSGSTGEPVAHRKLWGALAARSRDAGRRFRLASARPAGVVGTVPAQHMYGFETTVLLPLHAPAASWCGPAFYPGDIRAALAEMPAPRVLVTTPLQLRALLRAGAALPPLERVISATAPLYPDLAAAVERAWAAEVWEIFGATEVGSIASRRTAASDVWTAYPRIRLHGGLTRAGEEEMLVTGPFSEPCALNDLVERLDPMRFRLLGRRTDVIKLGGRRISLAGLNRVLTSLDGVVDGLFVAPDDLESRPTARLLAFVVAPGVSAEALMAQLRGRVDPLFLPRRIVHVDTLPRNETGKLPDKALADLRARAGDS